MMSSLGKPGRINSALFLTCLKSCWPQGIPHPTKFGLAEKDGYFVYCGWEDFPNWWSFQEKYGLLLMITQWCLFSGSITHQEMIKMLWDTESIAKWEEAFGTSATNDIGIDVMVEKRWIDSGIVDGREAENMKKMPTLGFFKDIQKKIANNSSAGNIFPRKIIIV